MTKSDYDELDLLLSASGDHTLNLTIVDHPLVRDCLSTMREQGSDMASFRNAMYALTPHLIYAATADLNEKKLKSLTPLAPITTRTIKDSVVLIPVLRSGIGMHTPAQAIFPHARTIFAGMARDEATAIPHWYYDLKDLKSLDHGLGTVFLLLDPMLATGGSAIETIGRIKQIYPDGVVKMICMIAAPEGVRALNQAYPEISITAAAVDDHLNEKSYIVPGLGDAGDRQFGTA